MIELQELNDTSDTQAAEILGKCCGASRWIEAMISKRPFESPADLYEAADSAWGKCGRRDYLEAFSHHPRIGERRVDGWAQGEQSGARDASSSTQEELAQINREYEKKFGYIYIVCATGKSADEMLGIARSRIHNDPESELRIAAEEQRKIMQLRLRKLLGEDP